MGFDYDVIVVGAGPGGSTAARLCSKSGLKTILIEKHKLPRYKPCGGCLSLKTINQLEDNIDHLIENTIFGVKFSYCFKDPFIIKSKNPIAYLIMRDRFDHFLVQKAVEHETEILESCKVVRVEPQRRGACVYLSNGDNLFGEFLIGADGAESIVAKSIFKNGRDYMNGLAIESEIPFGESIHFPRQELHYVHLDFGQIPNGYGWVFPKKDFLSIGIGGMFKEGSGKITSRYLVSFFRGLKYLPEKSSIKCFAHKLPTFYSEDQKISKNQILLVGDAAHLMDPLQGEGIYYAIYSGKLAAKAIIESKEFGVSPSEIYDKEIKYKIFQNFKWAYNFSRFVFRFTKLAYKTLKSYPELGDFYLDVLEGKETYYDFIMRVKYRMRSLLKGEISEKIKNALDLI